MLKIDVVNASIIDMPAIDGVRDIAGFSEVFKEEFSSNNGIT